MELGDVEEVLTYRVGSRLVIEPKRPSWSALMDAPDVGDYFLSERPGIGIDLIRSADDALHAGHRYQQLQHP